MKLFKSSSLFALMAWVSILVAPVSVLAEVRLPAIISDHMVLQRDVVVPV